MKKFLLAACVSAVMASCNSDGKSSSAIDSAASKTGSGSEVSSGAAIKFEKNNYDFGTIKQGARVTYDFEFENTGTAPLIISNATASCGCTVPEFPKTPIAPGESGKIKVVFSSAGREGKQHKTVTITSNTTPPLTEVYLIGEVKK